MSNLRKAWHLYNLMKSQWKPYEELKELQDKKLRAILKHAYENVPFYHEKFDRAGVHPDDIKTVEDLPRLPMTTKQEVRENFPDKIVARGVNLKKCWLPHTSGSTGIPLTVAYDEVAEDFEKAVALRPNLSCGQGLFDKWIGFTDPRHIGKKKWFQRFRLFNPVEFSLFEDINKQTSILKGTKPDIIGGYPSHLYLLAKSIKQEGIELNPKMIFTTAELLDAPTREYIQSAFNTVVYDQFGGVELGRTAWECPAHSGYHIDVEAVVMEFVRDGKQVSAGEEGEIFYTGLYNYAMPLIRYAVGDIGIPSDEKCPCGRGLPLMKIIEGRKDDFLVCSDGTIVSPITMDLIVKNIMEIEQCRIVQERRDRIEVQITTDEGLTDQRIRELEGSIKEVLGQDVTVQVQIVERLPVDKGGKLRKVISKVKIDWDRA